MFKIFISISLEIFHLNYIIISVDVREIIAVYSDNQTNPVNALSSNMQHVNVKEGGT
jgi:hypothetical protein